MARKPPFNCCAWLLLCGALVYATPLPDAQKPEDGSHQEPPIPTSTASPIQTVMADPILTHGNRSRDATSGASVTYSVAIPGSGRKPVFQPHPPPLAPGTAMTTPSPSNSMAGTASRASRNMQPDIGLMHGFQLKVTSAPFRVGPQERAHRFLRGQRPDNPPIVGGVPNFQRSKLQNASLASNHNYTEETPDTEKEERRLLALLPQLLAQTKSKIGKDNAKEYVDWLANITRNLTHSSKQLSSSKALQRTPDRKPTSNVTRDSYEESAGSPSGAVRKPVEDRICIILHSMGDEARLKLMEQLTRMTYPTAAAPNTLGGRPTVQTLPGNGSAAHNLETGKVRTQLGKTFKTFHLTQQQHLEETETETPRNASHGDAQGGPQRAVGLQPDEPMDIFTEQVQEQWEDFVGKLKQVARETWDHVARQMARSLEKLNA
uniref:Putative conserved secreted protein n=1 Tax=Ixodes ricinus TaxID=34613 RepID=A0A6B0VA99_IXORI